MKRAVLIGIRYFGTPSELLGCINDIHDVRDYLVGRGYSAFVTLEDSPADPGNTSANAPTRANILTAIENAVSATAAGDTLYIHYSGHGSQVADENGDERDGMDECLCPVDYDTAGPIVDDELRQLIDRLPAGAILRVFFDACHSGSALDLPRRWRGGAEYVVENQTAPQCTDIVFISGCRDSQYSADADFNDRANGAMTMAFLACIAKATPRTTWARLVRKMCKKLDADGFDQTPQISYVDISAILRPISL